MATQLSGMATQLSKGLHGAALRVGFLKGFRNPEKRPECTAQIDILIVNCSLFNPTPSLSAMLVNHFRMKSNVVSYNLSGMGCSAGVIAISLAKELLQVPRPACTPRALGRWS